MLLKKKNFQKIWQNLTVEKKDEMLKNSSEQRNQYKLNYNLTCAKLKAGKINCIHKQSSI